MARPARSRRNHTEHKFGLAVVFYSIIIIIFSLHLSQWLATFFEVCSLVIIYATAKKNYIDIAVTSVHDLSCVHFIYERGICNVIIFFFFFNKVSHHMRNATVLTSIKFYMCHWNSG